MILIKQTLRTGDTLPELEGILSYNYGTYEIHPTIAINFARANERSESPVDVGTTLKVASFNVLNYFKTLDVGTSICGPSSNLACRGADSHEEFTRQRDKILAAITTLDADVIGIMEIENHQDDIALIDLVENLNVLEGAGVYDYVPTGTIGTDAIKVALLFKPAKVTSVGSYAILDSSVDTNFSDTNRPSLAQTFQQNDNGEKFTIAVNHLKSKGSACDNVGDPDVGDGQGNCNLTRTTAASALINWLALDPTSSEDPDYLIIGDLNSYAMEDPISTIKANGYTDLLKDHIGNNAYSYVFSGQSGYLDHALANNALEPQVTGITVWHINADEPSALDYNNYNQPDLYESNVYRASDHDPILIGMQLTSLWGDVNGDRDVNLKDMIVTLQVITEQSATTINQEADTNGDGKIGLSEALYILQKLSQL